MSTHQLHSSPLQFFEENFSPLLKISRDISIRYILHDEKSGSDIPWKIEVHSVNECSNPVDFREMLVSYVESSMKNLLDSLLQVHKSYWEPYLDYIRKKLEKLTSIVEDERFFFQDVDTVQIREHRFKSFITCRLIGPKEGDLHLFGQCIRFKALQFAETWLEVTCESIDQLDLIHNLLLQSLSSPAAVTEQSLRPERKNGFIVKTILSVAQLGVLFRLFEKSGIFEIPNRCHKSFILWVCDNFQSKNREIIKIRSLRNKFFTLELQALDFWEEMFKKLILLIQQERDQLTAWHH